MSIPVLYKLVSALPLKKLPLFSDLRREAVSGLCEALSGKYYRKTTDEKKEKRIAAEVIEEKNNTYDQFKRKENFSYSVLVENKEQLSAVCASFSEYMRKSKIKFYLFLF